MRGRPILGAICGLLFGFFVALDLFAMGVVGSQSPLLLVLPVAGLVLGVVLGLAAPFRRSRAVVPGSPSGPVTP